MLVFEVYHSTVGLTVINTKRVDLVKSDEAVFRDVQLPARVVLMRDQQPPSQHLADFRKADVMLPTRKVDVRLPAAFPTPLHLGFGGL